MLPGLLLVVYDFEICIDYAVVIGRTCACIGVEALTSEAAHVGIEALAAHSAHLAGVEALCAALSLLLCCSLFVELRGDDVISSFSFGAFFSKSASITLCSIHWSCHL